MSKFLLPNRETGLVVVESVASLILISLALIGNIFILAALYRNTRLRNTTNVYIAALAVTDLLNACIPGTLFASSIIAGRLVYSMPVCRLSGFLVHYLTYVSMATMSLTAVNRYYRVVRPQYFHKLFSFKRSVLILLGVWFIVAVFVLYPRSLGLAEFSFNPAMSICAYKFASQTAETVFTLIVVCIFVVLCLSMVSASYYRVSRLIRRHKNDVSFSLQGVSAREIDMTKVLFTLVLAFAVCWLPTFAVILVMRVMKDGASRPLAMVIPFLFQTSSAVNPLIYGAMSPPFRREFRQLLLFKRQDQPSIAEQSHFDRSKSPNIRRIMPLETCAPSPNVPALSASGVSHDIASLGVTGGDSRIPTAKMKNHEAIGSNP